MVICVHARINVMSRVVEGGRGEMRNVKIQREGELNYFKGLGSEISSLPRLKEICNHPKKDFKHLHVYFQQGFI